MRHLITLVEDLRSRGIGFRSLNEDEIDTACDSGELIFHTFSALAQFERRLIQERTKAGLAATRARGRNGGRPKIDVNDHRAAGPPTNTSYRSEVVSPLPLVAKLCQKLNNP